VTFAAWGAPEWWRPAAALLAAGALAVAWSYWRSAGVRGARGALALAAALKTLGLAGLALCLVDPLWTGVRPRPGANIFAVVADDSQSLQIHDAGASAARGAALRDALLADSAWQTRLDQDFDVRRLAFSAQLRAVDDFSVLRFDGAASHLGAALESLGRRFRGLPVAGVLLMTDGNATDAPLEGVDWRALPPIYPVVVGADEDLRDVSVERVSVGQTNFDAAPVTIRAEVRAAGYGDDPIVVNLRDEQGKLVESQTVTPAADGAPSAVRFQLRPKAGALSFYSVGAFAEGSEEVKPEASAPGTPAGESVAWTNGSDEATLANNRRLVAVDRGGGPFRVLYASGRPNWEFKFLRRALSSDDQLELVGLVRIARRQPKFSFRRRGEASTNELFEGFDHGDDDTAEQYDEPVLVRFGTIDDQELRGGFPRTADELYHYHAIVLDDLGAEFFSQDQLALIEQFVSRRGGGLLMLGGPESFAEGKYDRTPVGDVLPVYLTGIDDGPSLPLDQPFRLALTREGWLQPWVRLRKTEPEDRERLAAMPEFRSVNPVGQLKPGATVLASVVDPAGAAHPALVAQRYGRGRSAALLVGDLWKWAMRDSGDNDADLAKSWRQTVRWLVADVPERVEVEVEPGVAGDAVDGASGAAPGVAIHVRVRDAAYLPLDNAEAVVRITPPGGKPLELEAEPSAAEAGVYVLRYVPRAAGAHRAVVAVKAPDGSPVGERETGWASQPQTDEFSRLAPNRDLLAEIAAKTGGQVLTAGELNGFVSKLNQRPAPITEPWTRPLWHHPLFFLAIIACFTAEWGMRRWKGLP